MENTVKTWLLSGARNGKYLHYGDNIETALYKRLENYKKNSSYKPLLEIINLKKKPSNFGIDALFSVLIEDMYLDFDFAKDLNAFDIITSKCFNYKSERGKAMINLLDSDLKLILCCKQWLSTSELYLEFEPAHEDYYHESIINIRKGDYW